MARGLRVGLAGHRAPPNAARIGAEPALLEMASVDWGQSLSPETESGYGITDSDAGVPTQAHERPP